MKIVNNKFYVFIKIAYLQNDEFSAQHVQPAGEIEAARLPGREAHRHRLVKRQLAPDIIRGNDDFAAAFVFGPTN